MSFNFQSISSGWWKTIFIFGIIIFLFLYLSQAPTGYFVGVIVVLGIFIFFLGSSNPEDKLRPRTEEEIRKIMKDYIGNVLEKSSTAYGVDLPPKKGEIKTSSFHCHDWREDFLEPVWEVGIKIMNKNTDDWEYFSIDVDGLTRDRTIMGLRKLEREYTGQRFLVKYVVVRASEYESAITTAYQKNRAQGLEYRENE